MKVNLRKRAISIILAILLIIGVMPAMPAGASVALTLQTVDFEMAGSGYTASTSITTSPDDWWERTDGTTVNPTVAFSNWQGSYFYYGEDTSASDGSDPVDVTLDALDVTGYTDLQVKILLAANNDAGSNFEGPDSLKIQYSYDGGAYTTLAQFIPQDQLSGSTCLTEDSNADGTFDGAALSTAFAEFTYDIPKAGSNLRLRILVVSSVDNEEVGFDNIRIYGTEISSTTPTLTTGAATDITQTTATANGNITSLGSPDPTQHGFVWDTSADPTVDLETRTEQGTATDTGAFTGSITGLTAGTTYHVRAYATNTAGTSYGDDVTFTTESAFDAWDGSTAAAFAGGDGSSGSPYVIETAEQLAYMSDRLNTDNAAYRDKYYTLTADLDLAGYGWTPIAGTGNNLLYFGGVFYGNGHKVSNVTIGSAASPDTTYGYVGLFGNVYMGTISDLGVEDAMIYSGKAGATVGGLAGCLNGISSASSAVSNCYVTGHVSGGSNYGYVGGLVGMFAYSTASNCYSVGSVVSGDHATAGGLFGVAQIKCAITDCYSTSSVLVGGGSYPTAGGLIGYFSRTDALAVSVTNCYATGNTAVGTASEGPESIGGLIGYNEGDTVVSNCYYNSSATQTIASAAQEPVGTGYGTDDVTAKTSAEMKAAAFVTALNDGGSSWMADADEGNQGYPVLTATGTGACSLYQITYSANGATGGVIPTDTGAYPADFSVVLAANTGALVKTGNTFSGWNTQANGLGTGYSACSAYTVAGDVTLYAAWTADPVPVLTMINPSTGSSLGGTSVTITGQYFTGATAVTIGGAAASFTVVNDTTITATTPAGTDLNAAVLVTTPAGTSTSTLYFGYTSAAPTVTTGAASAVAQTTATANGIITSLGSPNPTQHGFVWSTEANPTVALSTKTEQGATSSTGAFTGSITGLTAGTTYHVRAYATNSIGTSYGDDVTFTTAPAASAVLGDVTWTTASAYTCDIAMSTSVRMVTISVDSGYFKVPSVGSGTLTFLGGTNGTAFIDAYGADTQYDSAVFSFADVPGAESLLSNIVYSTGGEVQQTVTVTASTVSPEAGDIYFQGHFYRYVSTNINWAGAVVAAHGLTDPYFGGHGYIATATSQAENSTLLKLVDNHSGDSDHWNDAWMGGLWQRNTGTVASPVIVRGTDGNEITYAELLDATEIQRQNMLLKYPDVYTDFVAGSSATYIYSNPSTVKYYWIDGPEAGQEIANNTADFAPWHVTAGAQDEPNGGDFVYIGWQGAYWDDLSAYSTTLSGYIVEFSGFDGGSTAGIIAVDTKLVDTASVPAPTVMGISPSVGPTAGGTSVTITGENFTGATSVTIGGAAATGVTVVSPTSITAVTPAGTAGAKDVSVTTPYGTGTETGLFTYANPPAVTSVTGPSNGTYMAGQNLDFTVNWDKSVTVSTLGGTPTIELTVGATIRSAAYYSGSGTTVLTFRYTVQAGDLDADGVAVGVLAANGGTFSDTITGANAVLTLNSVGSTLAVLVDGVAPTVMSIAVPSNGTYAAGGNLDFTVNMSENVTVGTVSGTPRIALDIGGVTRYATYLSGTGTSALTFRYTVTSLDYDSDGISVAALTAHGGTIRDAVSNDAVLTLNSVGVTGGVLVDGVAPAVTAVTVPANGTYIAGQNLDFTVNFNENVTVTGTPRVSLDVGGVTQYADYNSGSGTAVLQFRYTAQTGDLDADGVEVGALSLNSGTIKDAAGNGAALTLNSVGSTTNVLVDCIAPTVTSVTVPADGTYVAGESLDFTVNFSENVTVNMAGGSLKLMLMVGSFPGNAQYYDGSGTSALLFRYTVLPGDLDLDGIMVRPIAAYDVTIKDAAGNNAILTLTNVGDTTYVRVGNVAPPAPSSPDLAADSDTGVSSTDNITADGTPTFTGTAGAGMTVALYADGTLVGTGTADGSGNWSITVSTPLADGTYAITAKAKDAFDNLSAASAGLSVTVDNTNPVAGGAITADSVTKTAVTLTWPMATDAGTLLYKAVYSTSDNIASLMDAVTNGTTGIDWTTGITGGTVTGLSSNTTYYFNVLVQDEAGNMMTYTSISAKTARASSSSRDDDVRPADEGAPVIVNGESKPAGTSSTEVDDDGRTTTTVTVDTGRLEDILDAEDTGATVVIPFNGDADTAVGVLTGDMVETMADRDALLVISAFSSSYTLPAAKLDIDAIATQFGENVQLSAITVSVGISQPSDEMVTVVQNAANGGGFTLVVPGLEFTVTCEYGGRTIEVDSFKAYVERTVAIPEGVDPEKITTGVIVEPDGTVRHVPTKITVIDGKYYAVIKSRTNSVYAVVWNPVEFADVAGHWAKEAINDMGSRMVVNGVDETNFEPDRNMTRAEFSAIIVRALGLAPGSGTGSFADVNASAWYAGYVETAAASGIITGYDANTFGPNDLITREQAMTMISRAMQLTGLNAGLNEGGSAALLGAFTDEANVSSYAQAGIANCLETGIVTGRTDGTLAPKESVTRAEIAVMVRRLLQKSELI